MTSKKILFVEPRGVKANVFSRYLHLPLMGPIILATQLKKAGHNVKVINENLLGSDIKLTDLDADILCLTSLTPTVERAYTIARLFRNRNPRSLIIMGGIHASFMPHEALMFADHVITGEAESIINDIITYGADEKIISAASLKNIDNVPIPDFSLLVNSHKMKITPIISSRGCPFGCTFCSVTAMFGRGYRTLSIDRLMEEISRVRTRKVFFYDDNFAVNKKRLNAILERLQRLNRPLQWTAQVRTDITKDERIVERMARAGCSWVYIGFESIDDQVLDAYHKNQRKDDVIRAIRVFHKYGISIHGMFIFGSDFDTPEVFSRTVTFSKNSRIDSVQYLILTPFPGTELSQKLEKENRIIHRMWQYYDCMHSVFLPKNMTAEELQKGMFYSFTSFYSLTRAINDAFNSGFYLLIKPFELILRRIRREQLTKKSHLWVYVIARRIVKLWFKLNEDYLLYMKEITEQSFADSIKKVPMFSKKWDM